MNYTDQNKQVVLSSAIVAKAAVRMENGKVNLIVVFQESTRYEFYWIFQARSARSPRKSWKFCGARVRDFKPLFDFDGTYRDFGSFVEYYARSQHGQVLSVRVHHARRMATLLAKTNHESLHSNWGTQNVSAASFELVNKRMQAAFKPSGFYVNRRDRALDDLDLIDANEVLVYDDYCPDCNTRHAYAHFPNGKRQCKVGFSEMKKNPGYEYRGFENRVGFKFVSRTAAYVPQGV
jgi:hypothetical protein